MGRVHRGRAGTHCYFTGKAQRPGPGSWESRGRMNVGCGRGIQPRTRRVHLSCREGRPGMGRWRKRTVAIVAAVAIIVVVAGGVLIWRLTRPASAATVATTTTAKAAKSTQRTSVSATGTLAPQNQAYLNFPAAGTVSAVNVQLGQTVAAGQVLATQNTTTLASAVTSAQAGVDSAQSSLDTLNASSSTTTAQISACLLYTSPSPRD